MTRERLERWHVEAEEAVSDQELVKAIYALERELKDPTTSPRRAEELDRRINHLIFEVQMRMGDVA